MVDLSIEERQLSIEYLEESPYLTEIFNKINPLLNGGNVNAIVLTQLAFASYSTGDVLRSLINKGKNSRDCKVTHGLFPWVDDPMEIRNVITATNKDVVIIVTDYNLSDEFAQLGANSYHCPGNKKTLDTWITIYKK